MCKDSGIPIKMEQKKNSATNHSYNYLWNRTNSNAMICRLRDQKLVKIWLKLQEVKQRKKVSRKVL